MGALRVKGWLLAVLFLFGVGSQGCTTCRNTILRELPSPSGEWRAGLIARTCGSAHGLVVNVAAQDLPLLKRGSNELTVLNVGLPCCLDPEAEESRDLVAIEWQNDFRLRVSYPRSLQPFTARAQIGPVEVDLRAVPAHLDATPREHGQQ